MGAWVHARALELAGLPTSRTSVSVGSSTSMSVLAWPVLVSFVVVFVLSLSVR